LEYVVNRTFLCFWLFAAIAIRIAARANEISWGEPVSGWRVGLEVPTNGLVESSGRQPVTVFVQNTTDNERVLPMIPHWFFFAFTATDEHGNLIPEATKPDEVWSIKSFPISGGGIERFDLDLQTFLVITNSGELSVSASYKLVSRDRAPQLVFSGTVPIHIPRSESSSSVESTAVETNENVPAAMRPVNGMGRHGQRTFSPLRTPVSPSQIGTDRGPPPATVSTFAQSEASPKSDRTYFVHAIIFGLISLVAFILIRARLRQKRSLDR
jgi:hypothetical protein